MSQNTLGLVLLDKSVICRSNLVFRQQFKMRGVQAVVESKWQSEGRGARVRRSIGRPELRNLDPFLLLDEFEGSRKDGAGFPDHPHRQVSA